MIDANRAACARLPRLAMPTRILAGMEKLPDETRNADQRVAIGRMPHRDH